MTVAFVLYVSGGEDTLDTCLRRPGNSNDVAVRIGLKLTTDDGSCRFMTNGIEQTVDLQVVFLAGDGIANAKVLKDLTIPKTFAGYGVP